MSDDRSANGTEPGGRPITAVLPLRIGDIHDGRDLQRAELLFESLVCFGAPELFARTLVICPAPEVSEVEERLSRWSALRPEFLAETWLLPAFRRYSTVGGWIKQQIIKLAAHRVMETPFYLTLDADVICTHALSQETLLPGGRALLDPSPKTVKAWWAASARVLGVPVREQEPGMGVTPALLATEVVASLASELDSRTLAGSWSDLLMRPHRRFSLERLRRGHKSRHSWTEYTLYFLHARERGLLDRWHVFGASDSVPQKLISSSSAWQRTDLEDWDPGAMFSTEDPALFAVFQSNRGEDPAKLARRIRPYFP